MDQDRGRRPVTLRDRIIGGMIGLVVGDALGVPAEFKSRDHLRRNPVTGMTGYGTHNQPAGTWSDDSSLTLATADSLLGGYSPDDMIRRFSRWWETGYMTPHGAVVDIGNATSAAIQRFNMKVQCDTWGSRAESDNGNGSLMRILPLALYRAVNLGNDTDTTAAVTGGLAGVRQGTAAIPEEWRRAIARIDDVMALIEQFADMVCTSGQ